ncbi:origin recognition complex subunit 6-like [Homarus americanus]|uniref:origin recognition complex subunit 6-like n=1 Tax=Homarus americanus TaxID=6706 RepID=UPI001C446F2B|nr:origin recognition complex subunit 6-like [Homarus americanus]XP_042237459.1 origin recognition complex subunit 6-like [Homarus americanus]
MEVAALHTLALKLGLTSTNTLRKAEELIRLLAVRGGSRLSLSMSGKAVICLEMAAALTGATVDKNLVIKLAGLRRSQYVGMSQTVSRLLNVSPGVSVAELCVTYSATAATNLAQRALKQYDDSTDGNKGDIDTSLPVYQTAAVVAACKVMNIKVDKRRLFESSCSKRAVYQKLVDVLVKIAQEIHTQKSVKNNKKRTRTLLDMVEDNLRDCSPEKRSKGTEDGEEEEDGGGDKGTDFEDWKKKILEAAAAAE